MLPSLVTLRVIWPPFRVSRVHSADIAGAGPSSMATPSATKVLFQEIIIMNSLVLIQFLLVAAVNLSD